jgi:hypothetical protein
MNGNGQESRDRHIGDLDVVENAIAEKLEHGHAEEERFGFAATVANATPPVDESFRQTLRASIVAEAAQSVEEDRRMRVIQDRGKEVNKSRLYPILRLAFALSATAALLAFVLVSPWGRTLAQSAWRFFVGTERVAFPLQPSQMTTPDPSAPTAQPPAPLVSIAEAERQAGFDVAELPFVPDGFNYLGARVYDGSVTVEYEAHGGGGSLVIRQSPDGFAQSEWDKVPEQAIVPVKIGELDGEFAQGMFVVYAGDTDATWNPDAPVMRMRWVEDGIWFEMTKFGDVEAIEYLDRAFLTELAAGLGGRAPVAHAGPQLASEDIDALARRLNEEPDPRTVAVFPADYAPALAEHIKHEVVPLAVGDDLAPAKVQAALGAALPHNGLVDVVLVDQDGGEAAKRVRGALEQQLYRLYRGPGDAGVETFGVLERKQYVAGSGDVTLQPIGVTFDNGIELVEAGVIDTPRPGEPLRIALEWRTENPVADPVAVFTHLMCEGQLVAQRDAIPGNGEFPASSWQPGELIRDQFALQLPAELPEGECQVQVGIYNPDSGRRYRPIGVEGAPFVVIQRFSVENADETL